MRYTSGFNFAPKNCQFYCRIDLGRRIITLAIFKTLVHSGFSIRTVNASTFTVNDALHDTFLIPV